MSDKILNLFARGISNVFLPPFVLFYSIYLNLMREMNIFNDAYSVLCVTFFLGVFIPIAVFIFLVKRSKIQEQDARDKRERNIPYIVGAVLMFVGQILLLILHVRPNVHFIWLSFLVNAVLVYIINKYWKISAHLLCVACAFMNMCLYAHVPVMYLAIVLVLVGWARYQLECHNEAQLLAGSIVGMGVPLGISLLLRSYGL